MTDEARALALAHKVMGTCIRYHLDQGLPEDQRRHLPECQRGIDAIQSALAAARNEALEEIAVKADAEATDAYHQDSMCNLMIAEAMTAFAAVIRALKDRS